MEENVETAMEEDAETVQDILREMYDEDGHVEEFALRIENAVVAKRWRPATRFERMVLSGRKVVGEEAAREVVTEFRRIWFCRHLSDIGDVQTYTPVQAMMELLMFMAERPIAGEVK